MYIRKRVITSIQSSAENESDEFRYFFLVDSLSTNTRDDDHTYMYNTRVDKCQHTRDQPFSEYVFFSLECSRYELPQPRVNKRIIYIFAMSYLSV